MTDPGSRHPATGDAPEGNLYAIGLGSNLGERAQLLEQALALLASGLDGAPDGLVRVLAAARPIQTDAVGGPPGQGRFLNSAAVLASSLGPHQLLARMQAVETRLGRCRTVNNGPRTIDLDLLLRADGLVVHSGVLELPHPRLHLRAFVLQPLAEVAGEWSVPGHGRVRDLAGRLLTSFPACRPR